jgi:hypothetical protein
MKKTVKKIVNFFKALFDISDCIEAGVVSFEGEGRNKYGK